MPPNDDKAGQLLWNYIAVRRQAAEEDQAVEINLAVLPPSEALKLAALMPLADGVHSLLITDTAAASANDGLGMGRQRLADLIARDMPVPAPLSNAAGTPVAHPPRLLPLMTVLLLLLLVALLVNFWPALTARPMTFKPAVAAPPPDVCDAPLVAGHPKAAGFPHKHLGQTAAH